MNYARINKHATNNLISTFRLKLKGANCFKFIELFSNISISLHYIKIVQISEADTHYKILLIYCMVYYFLNIKIK